MEIWVKKSIKNSYLSIVGGKPKLELGVGVMHILASIACDTEIYVRLT